MADSALKTKQFLAQLDDLTGKVAIVTGGSSGIGAETCFNLAAKGCKVYIASRSEEAAQKCIERLNKRLGELKGPEPKTESPPGQILWHKLDLMSMQTARESALEFLKREQRLDILVANAGLLGVPQDELSPDGFEKTWQVNVLGHVSFVGSLLNLVEKSSTKDVPSRIVIVSSESHRDAKPPDYKALRTKMPGDKQKWGFVRRSFDRYGTAKLCNAWHAFYLSDLEAMKGNNVLVNTCHPGTNVDTMLGIGIAPILERPARKVLGAIVNSIADCAKTQTLLAAGTAVGKQKVTREYWASYFQRFGYFGTYLESRNAADRSSPLLQDKQLLKDFVEHITQITREVLGSEEVLHE